MGAEDITAARVWRAYRALLIYARAHAVQKGVPLPTGLSGTPRGLAIPAVDRIALTLRHLWDDTPMAVDPDYFCYLYLFAQLLRCSFGDGPVFTQEEGWAGLSWYPLHVLAGRDDAALRAWRAFYFREWQSVRPRQTEVALRRCYPWIAEPLDDALLIAEGQRTRLGQMMETHELSAAEIFLTFDALGFPRGASGQVTQEWHPWVVAALASPWSHAVDGKPPLALRSPAITAMFQQFLGDGGAKDCHAFLGEMVPFMNRGDPKAARYCVLFGVDRLVHTWPVALRRRWKLVRRRWVHGTGRRRDRAPVHGSPG